MFISNKPYWFTEEGIRKAEDMYDAQYMGAWCTRHSAGWWNDSPVDVFYQANPDREKGHSNYFGLFVQGENVYITNAESAFAAGLTGVLCEDGEVIVSRYRHDCVTKGDNMIDGGREYLRYSGDKLVEITVNGSEFEFRQINS
jgi:hypothetical protein